MGEKGVEKGGKEIIRASYEHVAGYALALILLASCHKLLANGEVR